MKEDDGGYTFSHDVIQTAALVDIAKSLRSLLDLARCPNVGRGYRSMTALLNLARKELRRPRRKKRRDKR